MENDTYVGCLLCGCPQILAQSKKCKEDADRFQIELADIPNAGTMTHAWRVMHRHTNVPPVPPIMPKTVYPF